MEDYNKIIESLSVRFVKARSVTILKPVVVDNSYEVENHLMLVESGVVEFGKEREKVEAGELLFIPGGKSVPISYGENSKVVFSKEDFLTNKSEYLVSNDASRKVEGVGSYCYVSFDTRAFDSVSFFSSLDIPPFKITNQKLAKIVSEINEEFSSNKDGKDRIVALLNDIMVVEIVRHIVDNRLFVEQFATNTTYFKDPRLIKIFTYIKQNLSSDLSNKVLAGIANVSEDYVGQYFKMLTGINPQDYIEYQRMEAAVDMLRTSKKSIRDIGKDVGYKDTAYFCRRFKMMFGIPAGKMRRRETLINV